MANYTLVHGQLINSDELMHYGVLGMKWGVRRSKYYENSGNRHTAKAERLQEKANAKRANFANTPNRKIKYAMKEKKYANAEKFHNKKALGLSYMSKLFGSTLDYKANKELASRDAVMKEKYSEAKTGTTNKINRLEYRAEKQRIKAEKAFIKMKISDAKNSGAGKDEVNRLLNSSLGTAVVSKTWAGTEGHFKDKHGRTQGYTHKKQRTL